MANKKLVREIASILSTHDNKDSYGNAKLAEYIIRKIQKSLAAPERVLNESVCSKHNQPVSKLIYFECGCWKDPADVFTGCENCVEFAECPYRSGYCSAWSAREVS